MRGHAACPEDITASTTIGPAKGTWLVLVVAGGAKATFGGADGAAPGRAGHALDSAGAWADVAWAAGNALLLPCRPAAG